MPLMIFALTFINVGILITILVTIGFVFRAYSFSVDYVRREIVEMEVALADKVKMFDEIIKKASEANLSLGTKINEFDIKLKDLENKINMMSLRVNNGR